MIRYTCQTIIRSPPSADTHHKNLVDVGLSTGIGASTLSPQTACTDFIVAGAGDDTICGMGGADMNFAGGGTDYVEGGNGADLIFGEGGDGFISRCRGAVPWR